MGRVLPGLDLPCLPLWCFLLRLSFLPPCLCFLRSFLDLNECCKERNQSRQEATGSMSVAALAIDQASSANSLGGDGGGVGSSGAGSGPGSLGEAGCRRVVILIALIDRPSALLPISKVSTISGNVRASSSTNASMAVKG